MRQRLISAAVLVAVVVAFFVAGNPWLTIGIAVLAALAAYEAADLVRAAGLPADRWLAALIAAGAVLGLPLLTGPGSIELGAVLVAPALAAGLMLTAVVALRQRNARDGFLGRPVVSLLLQGVHLAACLVGAHVTFALGFLDLIGRFTPMVADLDACLFHALVDEPDELPATLLGQRRDVQPHDRAIYVRDEADIALLDRLLDRAEGAPVPRLDDDRVRLRHADTGQLVERRRCAVVLDGHAFDERRRRAAGADGGEITLERDQRAAHPLVRFLAQLVGHRPLPPSMSVPIGSPSAAARMWPGSLRSKTTIGRSLSMHSVTAVASITSSRSLNIWA